MPTIFMQAVNALRVTLTKDSLAVDLSDGRTVSVPLCGTRGSSTGVPESETTGG